jgi:RNA polymerase sigma-70 factor (ECF subfamily)
MGDMPEDRTAQLEGCLDRLRAGDLTARDELLSAACDRLARLARKMLQEERRVGRWEESDDVLQNALLRLHRALETVHPGSVIDFIRLAAVQIRRELIDLARHHFGPEGTGAHHASVADMPGEAGGPMDAPAGAATTFEPSRLALWTEFHKQISELPAESREVFDLLFYQGLNQSEAAAILDLSERTLQRRWQSAREQLRQKLRGDPFG